mgnify:CR=1 FL=1
MITLILTFIVLALVLFFLLMKNNYEKIDEGLRISESITQYKPLRTKEDYINDTIDTFPCLLLEVSTNVLSFCRFPVSLGKT